MHLFDVDFARDKIVMDYREIVWFSEAAPIGVLWENVLLEISQNSQENTCTRVFCSETFIKKETLAQLFSCEFCEISKKTFFTEHLWTTASWFWTVPVNVVWSLKPRNWFEVIMFVFTCFGFWLRLIWFCLFDLFIFNMADSLSRKI